MNNIDKHEIEEIIDFWERKEMKRRIIKYIDQYFISKLELKKMIEISEDK